MWDPANSALLLKRNAYMKHIVKCRQGSVTQTICINAVSAVLAARMSLERWLQNMNLAARSPCHPIPYEDLRYVLLPVSRNVNVVISGAMPWKWVRLIAL